MGAGDADMTNDDLWVISPETFSPPNAFQLPFSIYQIERIGVYVTSIHLQEVWNVLDNTN